MPRAVDEWAGKTPDAPPPPRVKERVLRAHENRCALTGREIRPGDAVQFDHRIPLGIGGLNVESNLQPVLAEPHKEKTRADAKVKAKASRGFKRHFGLTGAAKRPVPGSKNSPWKKCLDGSVERRQ